MSERIAYEDLHVGDHIQDGDQWQNHDGCWQLFSVAPIQVLHGTRVRRPHKITTTQVERDEAQAALKSAQRARDELQRQVDELRADRDKLQGLIDDLLDEPTARQVQDMLRTWATELDWSADCFDSTGRDQINSLQGILIAVMERIEHMINPEGTSADA